MNAQTQITAAPFDLNAVPRETGIFHVDLVGALFAVSVAAENARDPLLWQAYGRKALLNALDRLEGVRS